MKYYLKTYLKLYREIYYTGWINEGISIEAMKKFNIGLHITTERITIPYFDINGYLIGVRGRTLREIDIKNKIKYMPMKHCGEYLTFPMHSSMYGIFQNQFTIRKLKKAVIFEAEKSVLQLESFYPNNNIGLALGGSNLFDAHVQLLLDLGVEDVYLALDKEYNKYEDNKYLSEYSLKIKQMKDKLINYFNVYIIEDRSGLLEYKDSPTDKGEYIFSKLVKESIKRKE
ncbi:MAG: DNA primase [Candidatus Izimaplasma bacterium HR2]|nr:MAG: DNA primase [Candidatus Izimaplasma bacterium HR2]